MAGLRLCIDTDNLIKYLKNREPGASAVRKAVKEYECFVTAITVYELYFGVEYSKRMEGEEEALGLLTVLPLDEGASKLAAKIHVDLIRRNLDIGIKDVLVASICLQNDVPLLTSNEKHFSRVPNLVVVTPEKLLRRSSRLRWSPR